MANRIMLNQTSYHGAGAIAEIVTEAKAHAFQKAFVCSDPDLIKFGVTGKVTGLLDKEGLAYEIYSDIKANPTIDNVKNGVAAFKASGADYIIAIGGGSSMDTSKAIGIIIANPEFEDVRSLEGVAPTRKPCVPIIAVPTTAGTAAEVTINYVITDVERKRKFVCVDHRCGRSRDDVFYAQGTDRFYRYGCSDPRYRRLHHQGGMGDDRYVPPEGNRDHFQVPARRCSQYQGRP